MLQSQVPCLYHVFTWISLPGECYRRSFKSLLFSPLSFVRRLSNDVSHVCFLFQTVERLSNTLYLFQTAERCQPHLLLASNCRTMSPTSGFLVSNCRTIVNHIMCVVSNRKMMSTTYTYYLKPLKDMNHICLLFQTVEPYQPLMFVISNCGTISVPLCC